MKDPYYAGIMFEIEAKIHERDQCCQEGTDVVLTDSNVKSAIRKTMSILRGKSVLSSPANEREREKGRVTIELVGIFEHIRKTSEMPRRDYLRALLAVEDSLKARREYHGHSRGYLDFLVDFMSDARRN